MLAYDSRGKGADTRLLLHGFLGSGRNLASLARRWSDLDPNVRLILPDLTGHGGSPPLAVERGLKGMAEDLLSMADKLHTPKPLKIIGHSMGGRVGLMARLLNPDAVGEIILLDISPRPMADLAGELQNLLERLLLAPQTTETREEMREFFVSNGISAPLTDWVLMNLVHEGGYYRWRIDRRGLGTMHRRDADIDLWEAIEKPGTRTRCIRGGNSKFVSDADVARLQKAGVQVETIPDAGHFVHVDAQAALLECLMRPAA